MKHVKVSIASLLAALAAACGPSSAPPASVAQASQPAPASSEPDRSGGPRLTVLTRNLYLGADIARIATATTPQQIPVVAGAMWATIQQSDFPARARLIAAEIDGAGADLVALEEATLYRTGPGVSCLGPTLPDASTVAIDFLALVQSELAARGLDYEVAAQVDNFDAQLCVFDGARLLDVRLTDRDAILVRRGLHTAGARSGHFAAEALFPAGGGLLPIARGWNAVEVKAHGRWITFAMTHLETEAFPAVQQAQAAELAALFAGGPRPIILSGDFNAGPELASVTTSYADLLASGYRDPWTELHPGEPGLSCCFDELLLTGALTERIDHNLFQGSLRPVRAFRVGLDDLTAAGQHASDHAGMVTVFRLRGEGRGKDGDEQ